MADGNLGNRINWIWIEYDWLWISVGNCFWVSENDSRITFPFFYFTLFIIFTLTHSMPSLQNLRPAEQRSKECHRWNRHLYTNLKWIFDAFNKILIDRLKVDEIPLTVTFGSFCSKVAASSWKYLQIWYESGSKNCHQSKLVVNSKKINGILRTFIILRTVGMSFLVALRTVIVIF